MLLNRIAKHSVCFLLRDKEGKVLAISRMRDTTKWGLPGGSVEPHESLEVAVVREVFEETGFVIAQPVPIFTAFVRQKICTTFMGQVVGQTPDAPRSFPFEGEVRWLSPHVLVFGPYANYNRALFDHMNIPYGR